MKSLLFTLIFILGVSCSSFTRERINASGSVVLEDRHQLSHFNGIDVCCGFNLILTNDGEQKVSVEADKNYLPYIETTVKGGKLIIKRKNNVNFSNNSSVKVYVSATALKSLSSSGGAKVEITNTLVSDQLTLDGSGGCRIKGDVQCTDLKMSLSGGGVVNLSGTSETTKVDLSGGGKADMNMNCRKMTMSLSGGGEITLSGSADDLKFSASGGGRLKGYEMVVKDFHADLSGGGRADIHVTGTIDVDASGGGQVNYKGNATPGSISLSGGGKLNKVD